MNEIETHVWSPFVFIPKNNFGKKKADNNIKLVNEMSLNFNRQRYNMHVSVRYLHMHSHIISENLGKP